MRSRSKVLAYLFIVLTLLGPTGSWHAFEKDPDFAGPVAHDHSQHHARFRGAAPSTAPEHCAFCHWLRAFGSGQAEETAHHAVVRTTSTVVHASSDSPRTAERPQQPSRAPPTLAFPLAG